jgi:hypothetical protein
MAQPTRPEWIQNLQQRNAKFAEMYWEQREHALQDGAIPAKYKILMTMIVDAITAHADGVANIANRARASGRSRLSLWRHASPGDCHQRVPSRMREKHTG